MTKYRAKKFLQVADMAQLQGEVGQRQRFHYFD